MRPTASLLCALALLLGGVAESAAQDAASRCVAAQFKAAGGYAAALARCQSRAAAKGVEVDAACEAKAQDKLAAAFAKAERKGDCRRAGAGASTDALVALETRRLRALLDPICCEGESPSCSWLPAEYEGCPPNAPAGPRGSACSGSGQCVAPPIASGPCCETAPGNLTRCEAGPQAETVCGPPGYTFVPDATCDPTQGCVAVSP